MADDDGSRSCRENGLLNLVGRVGRPGIAVDVKVDDVFIEVCHDTRRDVVAVCRARPKEPRRTSEERAQFVPVSGDLVEHLAGIMCTHDPVGGLTGHRQRAMVCAVVGDLEQRIGCELGEDRTVGVNPAGVEEKSGGHPLPTKEIDQLLIVTAAERPATRIERQRDRPARGGRQHRGHAGNVEAPGDRPDGTVAGDHLIAGHPTRHRCRCRVGLAGTGRVEDTAPTDPGGSGRGSPRRPRHGRVETGSGTPGDPPCGAAQPTRNGPATPAASSARRLSGKLSPNADRPRPWLPLEPEPAGPGRTKGHKCDVMSVTQRPAVPPEHDPLVEGVTPLAI